MSQCVPSWDLDDDLLHHRRDRHGPLPSSAAVATATAANYDVMELMWNDVGPGKPIIRNLSSIAAVSTAAGGGTDGGGGTLECIVDQARSGAHQTAADALVPCSDAGAQKPARVSGASCTSQGSATPTAEAVGRRRSMPPAGDEEDEGCGGGGGEGSPETGNGSFAGGKSLGVDQHDSLHSRRDELGEKGITSISAKRSREAAVHSQSERKRRDRINQKMKTLQKLLPNSSKTDKASVLDEVIEYLKLLQAQVQMMNRMSSIPMAMMLPIAMQQQLQLSMLAQMTQISRMGMSLGMNEQSILNMVPPPPILHPSTFLPLPPTMSGAWDARTAECLQLQGHRVIPDMVPTFMGYQAQQQPMSSEAYNRLAVLYQQLYQQPLGSNQKTRN